MKKKKPTQPDCCTVLAFGAHPDDIELTVGGTLSKIARAGHRAVAVDLTQGESGTRGTASLRLRESEKAARVLGLAGRDNLGMPDAGLELTLENRRAVAAAICAWRPEIILAPWVEDLHPDHATAGQIVRAAMFDARLKKLAGPEGPWFTRMLLHYPCRQYYAPTFVVDVTSEYPRKRKAFQAHRSQMGGKGKKEFRPAQVPDPFVMVETRDRHNGSLIGVEYGEGLLSATAVPLECLSILSGGK